jgi:Pycsar effector protein
MDQKELLESARDQLDRVLGFFPRVDAKASVVLVVDTGMLAFLVARVPTPNSLTWWEIGISVATTVLLGISLWFLYKGAFPSLKGGNASLVYFREIAGRTEAKFIEEFAKQSTAEHARDLLGQVWRNAEILKEKFDHVKIAFIFMALAIPPWVISLLIFTLKTAVPKAVTTP